MNNFDKLLERKKKEKGEMSKSHKMAKSSVLSDLMQQMGEVDGEKVAGLKKVSVAAPSKEGLEEGLDKAKDIVEEMPMNGEESEEEMGEESEEEMVEESPEELRARIRELQEKLQELEE